MKMKKIIALVLAFVMIAALAAACGDTNTGNGDTDTGNTDTGSNDTGNTDTGNTDTGSNDTGSNDTGSTPSANYTLTKDGMPQVTIMLPGFYGGEMSDSRDTDGAVQKAIEDHIGVSPSWQFQNSEGYGDVMNMTLLDPDNMPMILSFTGSISTTIIQAAQNGAFWDLAPFLDSGDYPNLATLSQDLRDVFTVNGALIAIPKMRDLGRYGLSYRGDWADKLGIAEPKTVDDVYNMLKAFREQDPDGNGQKDTYGLEVNGSYLGWMDVIFTWFGCGVGWVEQDGNLVPIHETAEFKEACDWIRKLTEEDIIRPDWPSVGTDGWGEATQKGQTGAFVDTLDGGGRRQWRYYIGDANVPSVTDTPSPDPEHPDNAWSVMVGAINNRTACTNVYNGGFLITKAAAKTEDDVKACLQFLDKMNDKEMRALASFGIEGVSYHMEDGYAVSDVDDVNNLPSQGINQAQAFLPFTLEDEVQAKPDAPGEACAAAQAAARDYAIIDIAMAYEVQSPTYVNENSNISTKINDAKVRYCAGVDTWDQFQAAVAEWEQLGGAAIKQEINDLYHANQG